jgi:hypothetical protein
MDKRDNIQNLEWREFLFREIDDLDGRIARIYQTFTQKVDELPKWAGVSRRIFLDEHRPRSKSTPMPKPEVHLSLL